MKVLHQIGPRVSGAFNTLEEILKCQEPISFDGVYTSVYENYRALKGKDVTFFYCGKYLGGDNSFDVGQPRAQFCTYAQIVEMADFLNAKIGYHGFAHLRCPTLTDDEIRKEIYHPYHHSIAWPYGDCDERTSRIAKEMGYLEGWSVKPKGDQSRFQKHRTYLNWHHG